MVSISSVINVQAVRALLLRLIHGDVGAAKQFLRRGVRRSGRGYADADPDRDHAAVDFERAVQVTDHRPADIRGDRGGAVTGDDQGKFVTADAGQDLVATEGLETGSDQPEEMIAGFVAIAVIHLLEAVEIEIGDRDGRTLGALGRHRLVQRRHERDAIRQPGEPVMQGGVARAHLALMDPAEAPRGNGDQAADHAYDQAKHEQHDRADAGMRITPSRRGGQVSLPIAVPCGSRRVTAPGSFSPTKWRPSME